MNDINISLSGNVDPLDTTCAAAIIACLHVHEDGLKDLYVRIEDLLPVGDEGSELREQAFYALLATISEAAVQSGIPGGFILECTLRGITTGAAILDTFTEEA